MFDCYYLLVLLSWSLILKQNIEIIPFSTSRLNELVYIIIRNQTNDPNFNVLCKKIGSGTAS